MRGEKEVQMRRTTAILLGLLAAAVVVMPAAASPDLTTQDLTSGITPTDLANEIAGPGVTVSNVTYTGANVAAGKFAGGTGIIGFEDGIMLSSGSIANAIGPNQNDGITTSNGTPGDSDLTALAGVTTNDAAVLEFDFVPSASTAFFQYVFASDEYNEYVNSQYNDVFAFFVNGTNCAVVGDPPVPVSINTINNGNPFGTDPKSHPELFRNNDLDDGGGSIDTEMDGLTTVLTCQASVNPNVSNHMKLAIADGSDFILDSNVFIQRGSLTTQLATLHVIKHVVNDNGGSASAADFTMSVTGTSPSPTSFPGAESPGTTVTLGPGSYNSTETGPSGYTGSFSADCSGTIAAGETKTCTVTNDDVAPPPVGDEGCSHGFWKNHQSAWAPTGYVPTQTVGSVFSGAGELASSTLLDALRFKGGSTVTEAKQILLRQAVAALLNAAHPGVAYPRTTAQVTAAVNAALASNDRTTILELASALDADNNLGCPLS
jgi:Prealbumin-like fold domain